MICMILSNITAAEASNEWPHVYDQFIMLDIRVKEQEIDEKEISLLLNELEGHFPSLIDYESGGLKKSPVSGSRGALLALLVELVAAELQSLAGIRSVFSDTKEPDSESYRIVFSCHSIEEGMYVARSAVELVNALIACEPFDITSILEKLILLHHARHDQKAEAA